MWIASEIFLITLLTAWSHIQKQPACAFLFIVVDQFDMFNEVHIFISAVFFCRNYHVNSAVCFDLMNAQLLLLVRMLCQQCGTFHSVSKLDLEWKQLSFDMNYSTNSRKVLLCYNFGQLLTRRERILPLTQSRFVCMMSPFHSMCYHFSIVLFEETIVFISNCSSSCAQTAAHYTCVSPIMEERKHFDQNSV